MQHFNRKATVACSRRSFRRGVVAQLCGSRRQPTSLDPSSQQQCSFISQIAVGSVSLQTYIAAKQFHQCLVRSSSLLGTHISQKHTRSYIAAVLLSFRPAAIATASPAASKIFPQARRRSLVSRILSAYYLRELQKSVSGKVFAPRACSRCAAE